MVQKRRLPIVSSVGEPPDAMARPAWHWVGFGTLLIFVVWLPAAALATGVTAGLAARAAASALSLVAAALAGGYVLGKWGAPGIGLREAALSGLTASVLAVVGASASVGFSPESLVVVLVGVPASAIGGKLGLRARDPVAHA